MVVQDHGDHGRNAEADDIGLPQPVPLASSRSVPAYGAMLVRTRYPVSVKTVWHARRKMHGRDGFQRLPVQQHQVTTVGRPVVDETHRHAVVLGGVRCGRYEDELAGLATGPERDGLGPPAGEVVPEDRVGRAESPAVPGA
jgi:hypothetical protein